MDRIRKLFRKLDPSDRRRLLDIMEQLEGSNLRGLDVQKLQGSDFYRIRSGRFRIIFHWSHGEAIVDSIRKRDEQTYRGLR